MESLESKLDRLTPEQRKEIEDFVDFLLSRSSIPGISPAVPAPVPPILGAAPPLLPGTEPVPGEAGSGRVQDPGHPDSLPAIVNWDGPASASGQELPYRSERITHDYSDYKEIGSPSPATEAVIKIKRKIIAKQEQDKPHHLLDWVD